MDHGNPDRELVRAVWTNRCTQHGVQDARVGAIDLVLNAYASAGRHYHNLRHIAACLSELATVPNLNSDRSAIEVALLFHDCVYDATRADNEERSADEATVLLQYINESAVFIGDVCRLILATRHASIPTRADEETIVDIDLAILGQPPAVFDEYERAIRMEYAHVSDAAFRAGRTKVLDAFLKRAVIYLTAGFRQRYEAVARSNLRRSISMLND